MVSNNCTLALQSHAACTRGFHAASTHNVSFSQINYFNRRMNVNLMYLCCVMYFPTYVGTVMLSILCTYVV